LEDLFKDRQELVLYDENNLEELVDYYLNHEEERERIATSGFNKVRSFHTYDHRVESIMQSVKEHTGAPLNRQNRFFEEITLKKVKFFQSRLGQCLSKRKICYLRFLSTLG